MKIVLTGASGFLGSHLARGLIDAGHTVTVSVRNSSCLERIEDLLDRIRTVDLDLEGLDGLFPVPGFHDAVIHAATFYGREEGETDAVYESNVRFPSELLDKAAAHGIEIFINTDTFFPGDYPPLSDYARTKKQFAGYGKTRFGDHGRMFIDLRLQHLYGPGDSSDKFIPSLVKSCLEGVPEIPLTDGKQKRDFVYVSDVVEAYLCVLGKVADMPGGYHQFDVGTGNSVSVRTLAEMIREASRSGSRIHYGAVSLQEGELMDSAADISRLAALGWSAKVGLEEGIRMTVDSYTTGARRRGA